ncbi:hypothetical protein [Metabacillus endolithicus]|uniref:Uncharacterized protein n=1 Tax=Metabacillus endolithicus TaxID=1535204 RepID=A0ABW5BVU6_9BACI|nr:hypothetical protein [Metabacillus endolithicus]UPG64736.1 hypothetical protein MVE64_06680 [Metabacillus endolithicus]
MRIIQDEKFFTIDCDGNVLKYSTGLYIDADMSGYNMEEPSLKELRKIYNDAQNVYFNMQSMGADIEECARVRTELANVYRRYKEALLERIQAAL